MAHYIGKFNSESDLRNALDNGSLLKPYVAYIGDDVSGHLDYNSLSPMTPGRVSPTAVTLESTYSDYTYLTIENSQDKYNEIVSNSSWMVPQDGASWGDRSVAIYVYDNPVDDRSGELVVNFYADDSRETLINSVTVSVSQPGRNEFLLSFDEDAYTEQYNTGDYVSGSTTVYILNNPYQYWVYDNSETAQRITGTTSDTSFITEWNENSTGIQKNITVQVGFTNDPDFIDIADWKYVYISLSANPNMSAVDPTNGYVGPEGGESYFTVYVREDADSFEIEPITSSVASAYTFNILSGTSTEYLTVTVPATQDYQNWSTGYFTCTFYKNSQVVVSQELFINQPPKGPTVTVVGTFITTSDNETLNVPNGDGFEYGVAILDNSDQVDVSNGTYTFANAGTHTLTYSRNSSDTYLQGWFMNSDVVSVDGSCDHGSWGCHNNQYYQQTTSMVFAGNQSLTGATFDSNFDKIGSSCFSGCTSLVSISIANPDGVNMGDAYPFDTITANAGTLHIPSGSTSNFTDVINALGQNWTVVDDL